MNDLDSSSLAFEFKDIFILILRQLQAIPDILNCALTKRTSTWTRDSSLWEHLTKKNLWFDPRDPNLGQSWFETYKQYRGGFFKIFQNQNTNPSQVLRMVDDGGTITLLTTKRHITIFESANCDLLYFRVHSTESPDLKDFDPNILIDSQTNDLLDPKLHTTLGTFLESGDYRLAFRSVRPYWSHRSDKRNYLNDQHLSFYNFSDAEARELERVQGRGFYQNYFKSPIVYPKVAVIEDISTIREAITLPSAVFELIFSRRRRSSLNASRVKFYKQQILSGLNPVVFAYGIIDNRKVRRSLLRNDVPYYDSLTVVISLILSGHHKMEAAAQLGRPIRVIQFIQAQDEDTMGNQLYNLLTTVPIIQPKHPLEVCRSMPKSDFPPVLINRIYETDQNIDPLLSIARTIFTTFKDFFYDKIDDFNAIFIHIGKKGHHYYVWSATQEGFSVLLNLGLVVFPEQVAKGRLEAPPPLPTDKNEWFFPEIIVDEDSNVFNAM